MFFFRTCIRANKQHQLLFTSKSSSKHSLTVCSKTSRVSGWKCAVRFPKCCTKSLPELLSLLKSRRRKPEDLQMRFKSEFISSPLCFATLALAVTFWRSLGCPGDQGGDGTLLQRCTLSTVTYVLLQCVTLFFKWNKVQTFGKLWNTEAKMRIEDVEIENHKSFKSIYINLNITFHKGNVYKIHTQPLYENSDEMKW